VAGAQEKNLTLFEVRDFQSVTGRGVIGRVEGRTVVLGNRRYFEELGKSSTPGNALEFVTRRNDEKNKPDGMSQEVVDQLKECGITLAGLDQFLQRVEALQEDGQSVMLVAIDGCPAGLLSVTDPIKQSTRDAIRVLKDDGVRIVMVTGDTRRTAAIVASKLGLDEFEAEVLPDHKGEIVKRLQAAGHVAAMAGDGINDAPALAQADVGIAMGTGTDIAIESAGITLVKGDLDGIARARKLSRAVMRNIRQNLFFAFVYNSLGIPLAAGVLYPTWGLLLSPVIASAAMTFSSVSVISNALRLRKLPL